MDLEALRAALQKALQAVKDFQTAERKDEAGAARGMNAEERTKFAELIKAAEDAKENVTMAEQAAKAVAGLTVADPTQRGVATPKVDEKPFKSFGEQLLAIAAVTMKGDPMGHSDKRLVFGKAAGANETVPSEGGFLLQEDYSTQLLNLLHTDPGILGRLTWLSLSTNSNSIKLPTIDEVSRARGSRWGGIRAYWLAEGEQKISSKPKFGEISLALNKIAALGYVTDELLEDASIIQAIMEQGLREEIMFEVTDAVFNGDGAGKPLGIMKSGAVIVVAEESGQANGSIVFNNLVKMMNHLPTRSRSRAVWVTGDSGTETALYSVTLPGGGGYPIFLPPGQNGATPGNQTYGTLLGRPVIPVEHLPGLGAAGDLMLVDFSEYLAIDKGGIKQDQSIHVRFIYDETCFRMVYRVDGQPAWRQPVTTANGAMTKSPFIALGARIT
jgi:HK97 family phage major capsid protein